MDRRFLIVVAVIGLHLAGLWALQTGLLHRAVELVVPVTVLADLIDPPQPSVAPPPPVPVARPVAPVVPEKAAPATRPAPAVVPAPTPMPLAVNDPAPAPQTATGVLTPEPATPSAQTPSAQARPPSPPAMASNDVRDNFQDLPPPPYPPTSVRLNETGSVVLSIRVESSGRASQVDVARSSGYPRLDDAAVKAAMQWRYIPRGGGSPRPDTYQYVLRFELH